MIHKFAADPNNITVPVCVLCNNNKHKLKLQRPKGQLYRDSPLYKGMILWDKLDPDIQCIDNHDAFIEAIKNEVVSRPLVEIWI